MAKTKNNKKLILQVVSIIIPLFLLMIAAVAFAMYRNTVESVLEGQNTTIIETLNQWYKNGISFYDDPFYYDYWESHPDLKDIELTPEEKKVLEESSFSYFDWGIDWMAEQSERIQMYAAFNIYSLFQSLDQWEIDSEKYNSVFVMDINEPNEGFIFVEFKNKQGNRKLGDKLDLDISKHSVLKDMLNDPEDQIVFERTNDFICEGSQYIGYKPIIINGSVRAVVGISYNWSDFQSSMFRSLRKAMVIGIGSMLTLMAIIVFLLYRLAIKPVGMIQRSVRDYISSKDSSKVTNDLKAVKTGNEFGQLSDNISELAREIDSYTAENIRLAGEKERVSAELDMAKHIQASQLPSKFPAFPDRKEFDIYASMTPAKEVGGDFYDFFLIDRDRLALVIADVSDKGVPAALFMMMSRMLVNNFASMGLEPHEVLELTNEKLCANNAQKMFVTVWLGILDLTSGKITAVNAGHEYPIIRQPGGEFTLFKDKHGFVVGGMNGIHYKQYEFTLEPGGSLFVYTDGVPEATDSSGNMFKLDRLTAALNKDPDASPAELLKNVRNDVDLFVGSAPQFDDLTMLAVRFTPCGGNDKASEKSEPSEE